MIEEKLNWLGDEVSLRMHMANMKEALSKGVLLFAGDGSDDEEDDNPVQLDKIGSLAVLSINGGTVSETQFWTRYFGIVSYDDIKERMYEVGDDPDVKAVILKINSPGGQAEGVGALAKFIRTFNNNVKPVVSFTDKKATSAAYWYGSAAQRFVASEDARLGSIGAIVVHMEYTEMLKEAGIKATVFRSAPYKALGTPYEKLDEKATAEIQKETMLWHNRFVQGISEMRNLDSETVNKTIANGRVFTTEEAMGFRMIDSVLSFEETVAKMTAALESKPNPASSV